jgi:transposase
MTSINRFEPEIRRSGFDKTTRYIATKFRRHMEEMEADGVDVFRTFKAVWEENDLFDKMTRQGRG